MKRYNTYIIKREKQRREKARYDIPSLTSRLILISHKCNYFQIHEHMFVEKNLINIIKSQTFYNFYIRHERGKEVRNSTGRKKWHEREKEERNGTKEERKRNGTKRKGREE
jgi:hypothetical protein